MKHFRTIVLMVSITVLTYFINSCGDTGVITPKNEGSLTVNNLPRLNPVIDGLYEAWVSLSTADHGDDAYRTIGRFNIDSNGNAVNTGGQPFIPDVSRIPDVNDIQDALITIEPPGNNDTVISISSTRILGGVKNPQSGKLHFSLSLNYPEVLGIAANYLTTASAKYTLAAPTTGDTLQYRKGAWFCQNTNGTAPGLTLFTIADSLDWIYQAWIQDMTTDTIYNMGRFSASNLPDDFYQCQVNSFPQWNLPGQEWTHPACPYQVTDLGSGNYKLFVTLEPRHENLPGLVVPSKMQLFTGIIPAGFNYGEVKQLNNTAVIPGAELIISIEQ